MGKILKAVVVIAIAVAVAYFAPALTPGFLTAALGATAATAATAAVLTTLATAALGAILATKPSTDKIPQVVRQSASNSFIIYGKRRVGGLMIFYYPDGKKYRNYVIVVAGHRCRGVTKWYLNNREVTVDGGGAVRSGDYKDNAWLYFARGTDDQEALPLFVQTSGGRWTTDHRCRGLALIYARFKMTDDVVQAGMPTITAEVEGKDDILDPRTGETGYTNNAALVFYDWMKLPREEGGFGGYADEFDDDWISAQANVCDEQVERRGISTTPADDLEAGQTSIPMETVQGLAAGVEMYFEGMETRIVQSVSGNTVKLTQGLAYDHNADALVEWTAAPGLTITENRYELDCYITTGASPSEIRDSLVICCAGSYTYSGGKHLMRPGYYVPPSVTLEEDDLAGPITVPVLRAGDQIITEVDGTYVDPWSLYQPRDVPTRSVTSADVAQTSLDLPHITSGPRAQRICEIMLRKAQAERRVTWPMNIMGIAVSALDTVQCNTARYGLSNYAFQVTSWGLSQDFSVQLSLEEHSTEIYDWDASQEVLPSIQASLAHVDVTEVPDEPETGSWSVAAIGGNAVLEVTGAVDDFTATGIVIEYRVAGTADWKIDGTYPPEATAIDIKGLAPMTQYEVAVSYSDDAGVGDRLALAAVTTSSASDVAQLIVNSKPDSSFAPTAAIDSSGSTATVTIPAHNRIYQDKTVAIDAGTITGLDLDTYYALFYDDPDRAGGAETFLASTNPDDALPATTAHPGRHYLGFITTPAAGSTGSSSGGGASGGGGVGSKEQLR